MNLCGVFPHFTWKYWYDRSAPGMVVINLKRGMCQKMWLYELKKGGCVRKCYYLSLIKGDVLENVIIQAWSSLPFSVCSDESLTDEMHCPWFVFMTVRVMEDCFNCRSSLLTWFQLFYPLFISGSASVHKYIIVIRKITKIMEFSNVCPVLNGKAGSVFTIVWLQL